MMRKLANFAIRTAISTARGKMIRRYPLVWGGLWLYNQIKKRNQRAMV